MLRPDGFSSNMFLKFGHVRQRGGNWGVTEAAPFRRLRWNPNGLRLGAIGHEFGHRFDLHVAVLRLPFVVGLEEDGADEADDGALGRQTADLSITLGNPPAGRSKSGGHVRTAGNELPTGQNFGATTRNQLVDALAFAWLFAGRARRQRPS